MGRKEAVRALLAEFLVVEDGVADETGGEGGAVRERLRRGEVVAEAEDQAVGAVVSGRAEKAGHDDAGGHGATDFGRGCAGEGKIEIVDDELAGRRVGRKGGHETRGVFGGGAQDRMERGIGDVVVGFERIVDLAGEVLGEGEGRETVEGTFPSAADSAAGDDES